MPERRLPDGRIEIYEEPGTLGFRVPMLTVKQVLQAQEEARRERDERLSTTAGPETPGSDSQSPKP